MGKRKNNKSTSKSLLDHVAGRSWSINFEYLETDGEYRWPENRELKDWLNDFLVSLNISTKTRELYRSADGESSSSHHSLDRDNLSLRIGGMVTEKFSIEKYSDIAADELLSLRVCEESYAAIRLIGVMHDSVFFPIWFDFHHDFSGGNRSKQKSYKCSAKKCHHRDTPDFSKYLG